MLSCNPVVAWNINALDGYGAPLVQGHKPLKTRTGREKIARNGTRLTQSSRPGSQCVRILAHRPKWKGAARFRLTFRFTLDFCADIS